METIASYDTVNKVIKIEMRGFTDKTEVDSIQKDFKSVLSKINPKEYTLLFDCTALVTFVPELLPILQNFYCLYMKLEFKKVIIVTPQNLPSKMQLKRVGKQVKFTGVFVDDIFEAEQMLSV